MRDLYQRLDLPPDASHQAITDAIEKCQHNALKQDASAVLGIPEHRQTYDELHATLNDIGRLRSSLGLSHGAHWQGSVANDFSLPPDQTVSRHDDLIKRVSHAAAFYNRWRHWRSAWLLIATLMTGTAVGLIAGLAWGMGWLTF